MTTLDEQQGAWWEEYPESKKPEAKGNWWDAYKPVEAVESAKPDTFDIFEAAESRSRPGHVERAVKSFANTAFAVPEGLGRKLHDVKEFGPSSLGMDFAPEGSALARFRTAPEGSSPEFAVMATKDNEAVIREILAKREFGIRDWDVEMWERVMEGKPHPFPGLGFEMPHPETTGEKVAEAAGGLAAFIFRLKVLSKAMPNTSPAVVWEMENLFSGGPVGHGAGLAYGLKLVNMLPLKRPLKVALESAGFGTIAAAGGGDEVDVMIAAAIPPALRGMKMERMRYAKDIREAKTPYEAIKLLEKAKEVGRKAREEQNSKEPTWEEIVEGVQKYEKKAAKKSGEFKEGVHVKHPQVKPVSAKDIDAMADAAVKPWLEASKERVKEIKARTRAEKFSGERAEAIERRMRMGRTSEEPLMNEELSRLQSRLPKDASKDTVHQAVVRQAIFEAKKVRKGMEQKKRKPSEEKGFRADFKRPEPKRRAPWETDERLRAEERIETEATVPEVITPEEVEATVEGVGGKGETPGETPKFQPIVGGNKGEKGPTFHGVLDDSNVTSILEGGLRSGTQVSTDLGQGLSYPIVFVYEHGTIPASPVSHRPGDKIVSRQKKVKPKAVLVDTEEWVKIRGFDEIEVDLARVLKSLEQQGLDSETAGELASRVLYSSNFEARRAANKKLGALKDGYELIRLFREHDDTINNEGVPRDPGADYIKSIREKAPDVPIFEIKRNEEGEIVLSPEAREAVYGEKPKISMVEAMGGEAVGAKAEVEVPEKGEAPKPPAEASKQELSLEQDIVWIMKKGLKNALDPKLTESQRWQGGVELWSHLKSHLSGEKPWDKVPKLSNPEEIKFLQQVADLADKVIEPGASLELREQLAGARPARALAEPSKPPAESAKDLKDIITISPSGGGFIGYIKSDQHVGIAVTLSEATPAKAKAKALEVIRNPEALQRISDSEGGRYTFENAARTAGEPPAEPSKVEISEGKGEPTELARGPGVIDVRQTEYPDQDRARVDFPKGTRWEGTSVFGSETKEIVDSDGKTHTLDKGMEITASREGWPRAFKTGLVVREEDFGKVVDALNKISKERAIKADEFGGVKPSEGKGEPREIIEEPPVELPVESPRVAKMKTTEVMEELNKKYTPEQIKQGYERYLARPEGRQEALAFESMGLDTMREGVRFEMFARLALSKKNVVTEIMKEVAPPKILPVGTPMTRPKGKMRRVQEGGEKIILRKNPPRVMDYELFDKAFKFKQIDPHPEAEDPTDSLESFKLYKRDGYIKDRAKKKAGPVPKPKTEPMSVIQAREAAKAAGRGRGKPKDIEGEILETALGVEDSIRAAEARESAAEGVSGFEAARLLRSNIENVEILSEALKKLSNDERYLIQNHRGLGVKERSLEDIAKEVGKTPDELAEIETNALLKLRHAIENPDIPTPEGSALRRPVSGANPRPGGINIHPFSSMAELMLGSPELLNRLVQMEARDMIEGVERSGGQTGRDAGKSLRVIADIANAFKGMFQGKQVKQQKQLNRHTVSAFNLQENVWNTKEQAGSPGTWAWSRIEGVVRGTEEPRTNGERIVRDIIREATMATAKLLESVGLRQRQLSGEYRDFKGTPEGKAWLAFPTTILHDIILRGPGKRDRLYETYAKYMAEANGMDYSEVREILDLHIRPAIASNNPRAGFRQIGPELERFFDVRISAMRVPKAKVLGKQLPGTWTAQLMMTEPRMYLDTLYQSTATRASIVKTLGQDGVAIGEMRTSYILAGGNPGSFDAAVRALSDIPPYLVSERPILTPRNPVGAGRNMRQATMGVLGILKQLQLSATAPIQATEPIGFGVVFGYNQLAKGMVGAMSSQEGRRAVEEYLIEHEIITPDVVSLILNRGMPTRDFARKFEGVISRVHLNKFANEYLNERPAAVQTMAWVGKVLERAKKGKNPYEIDIQRFELLDYDRATAFRLASGKGKQAEYDAAMRRGVRFLVGMSTSMATNSPWRNSKTYRNLIWYTSYFSNRVRMFDHHVSNINTQVKNFGANSKQAWVSYYQFGKLVGGTGLAGAVASVLWAYVKDGKYGLEQKYYQAKDNPLGFLTESFVYGSLGPVYGSIYAFGSKMLTDDTKSSLMDSVARLIMPLGLSIEAIQMFREEGAYKDLEPGILGMVSMEKLKKFAEVHIPFLRTMTFHEVMAKVGADVSDKEMDVALRASWTWKLKIGSEARPGTGGSPGYQSQEHKRYRIHMRRAMIEYRAGRNPMPEFMLAFESEQGDLAAAIRGKMVLVGKGMNDEQRAKLEKAVGPRAWDKLLDHDVNLAILAKFVEDMGIARKGRAAKKEQSQMENLLWNLQQEAIGVK